MLEDKRYQLPPKLPIPDAKEDENFLVRNICQIAR